MNFTMGLNVQLKKKSLLLSCLNSCSLLSGLWGRQKMVKKGGRHLFCPCADSPAFHHYLPLLQLLSRPAVIGNNGNGNGHYPGTAFNGAAHLLKYGKRGGGGFLSPLSKISASSHALLGSSAGISAFLHNTTILRMFLSFFSSSPRKTSLGNPSEREGSKELFVVT